MADELFYRKSIFFELSYADSGNLVDAFTLTIPPESYTFQQNQLVTRTRTFGGIVEDDYGLGDATIRISGNTGGVDSRPTYQGNYLGGSSLNFTGKEAIYYLYNRIIRYKDKYSDNYPNIIIRMYDLSIIDFLVLNMQNSFSTIPDAPIGYEVSLNDFKLSRNKDKPLFYSYDIELYVIKEIGKKRFTRKNTPIGAKLSQLLPIVNSIRNWMSNIQTAMMQASKYANSFFEVFDIIDEVESYLESYTTQAASMATIPIDYYYRATELLSFPADLCKSLLTSVESVADDYSQALEDATELVDELKDEYLTVKEMFNDCSDACSQLVQFGKSSDAIQETYLEIPSGSAATNASRGAELGDDDDLIQETTEVAKVSGITSVVLTASDTLESLALKYYNNVDYASVIAIYNSIDDSDLNPGDIIKIPLVNSDQASNDNQIFTILNDDVFGVDIKLTISGSLSVAESGDYNYISGSDNLVQAVNLRLNEEMERRIRLTSYGLMISVGYSNNVAAMYIAANIQDTVMQDPRIINIDNMELIGKGDNLLVSFDIHTISEDTIPYTGVL